MRIGAYIKKYLPKQSDLHQSQSKWFKSHVFFKPEFWHFNRPTVTKGVAAGLLIAFLPLPLQMLIAALLAILLRANIPIAVLMTWVTNPFTFVPINLFIIQVGEWVSGNGYETIGSIQDFKFRHLRWGNLWETVSTWIHSLGKSFLIGLPIVAVCSALAGYFIVKIFWQYSIRIRWALRLKKRKKAKRVT